MSFFQEYFLVKFVGPPGITCQVPYYSTRYEVSHASHNRESSDNSSIGKVAITATVSWEKRGAARTEFAGTTDTRVRLPVKLSSSGFALGSWYKKAPQTECVTSRAAEQTTASTAACGENARRAVRSLPSIRHGSQIALPALISIYLDTLAVCFFMYVSVVSTVL